MEPVALCCSSIHPESTEENLQKELRDTGECQPCWGEAPVEDLIFLLFLIFLFCHILKQKDASTQSSMCKTSYEMPSSFG